MLTLTITAIFATPLRMLYQIPETKKQDIVQVIKTLF